MKIKRIKKLKVNSYDFTVTWNKDYRGADFCFVTLKLRMGTKNHSEATLFGNICHELLEMCAVEMNVRLHRPDIQDDYIFVYDHRQHDTMSNMFAGLLTQFIH